MVGIKFARNVVPFPPGVGFWLRICFRDNVIVQGHVLWFRGEEIIDMANGGITTPEVIREGDNRSAKDNILVTYTKVEGVTLKKEAENKPPTPTQPSDN